MEMCSYTLGVKASHTVVTPHLNLLAEVVLVRGNNLQMQIMLNYLPWIPIWACTTGHSQYIASPGTHEMMPSA